MKGKVDAKSFPDTMLDAVYVRAQEDLILIPLRWMRARKTACKCVISVVD